VNCPSPKSTHTTELRPHLAITSLQFLQVLIQLCAARQVFIKGLELQRAGGNVGEESKDKLELPAQPIGPSPALFSRHHATPEFTLNRHFVTSSPTKASSLICGICRVSTSLDNALNSASMRFMPVNPCQAGSAVPGRALVIAALELWSAAVERQMMGRCPLRSY